MLADAGEQGSAVRLDERLVQLGGQPLEEAGERRAVHPLDDVAVDRQHVRVHLQPHVLLGEAELVQQLGVLLRTQHVGGHRVGQAAAARTPTGTARCRATSAADRCDG